MKSALSLMHPSSRLNQQEKEVILNWVEASTTKLTALGISEKK